MQEEELNVMINFDDATGESRQQHNPHWQRIPDHPHRILIIGSSRSGKTNAFLNYINRQPGINKIFFVC